jgi:hypothetical protein
MDFQEAALSDLVSLARRSGGLTMEDIRRALPVDSMTEEEIAHVIARLDEAGFDIEVDPILLLPDNQIAVHSVTPAAKRDETTEVSETMPQGRQEQARLPASVDSPVLKSHMPRHSNSVVSAPMLPWILAFAIVVLAVFAAFAF